MVPDHHVFFLDPNRCIGCQACVHACSECETHKGHSMIHLEYVDRSRSVQTVPVVCMHCESPTCADVYPADAIKRSGDGRVMTARKPRCIACNNCVYACPFGVPTMQVELELMMKCDMCYERREEIEAQRKRSRPVNEFRFGEQRVRTLVSMMVPRSSTADHVDVTAA